MPNVMLFCKDLMVTLSLSLSLLQCF